MANSENLIPITSKERARKLGSKGGSKRTDKKKWVSRLRELKKKGLTNKDYKKTYAIMTEKESYVFDAYSKCQQWLKECTDVKEKVLVGRLLNDIMKIIHTKNEKMNVEVLNQTNIQFNKFDTEEKNRIIERLIDENNIGTISKDNSE